MSGKQLQRRGGPGRPRKDASKPPSIISFQAESSVARFISAKEEYEKGLVYELSHAQFLDALLSNFEDTAFGFHVGKE